MLWLGPPAYLLPRRTADGSWNALDSVWVTLGKGAPAGKATHTLVCWFALSVPLCSFPTQGNFLYCACCLLFIAIWHAELILAKHTVAAMLRMVIMP